MTRAYVIGLDLSLVRTGVNVLRADDTDRVAHPRVLRDCGYSLPETAGYDERTDRIVAQSRTIARIIDKLPARPALALVEAPIFPKEVLASYFDRSGLWTGVWSLLKARDIPRAVVVPTTLKKWVTGSGRADKDMVLGEVRTWWPHLTIPNHDVADASGAAAMAAMRLGWRLPFPTRRRHLEGLVTVRWPADLDAPPITALGSRRYQGV